jgi:hypothetical protein
MVKIRKAALVWTGTMHPAARASQAEMIYTDIMTTIRKAFFWSGIAILLGTIFVLIIWPEVFGGLAIAALFVSSAMCVLARPWEREQVKGGRK